VTHQYATAHIDQQILLLRSFIASLNPNAADAQSTDALVPIQSLQTLTEVKRDLVSTIRQVVDVVSKYAGGSLPEPARATVRTFILKLPERWAKAARAEARLNGGSASATASTATATTTTAASETTGAGPGPSTPNPRFYAPGGAPSQPPTASAATQAAERVLTLATESLDMMRSVTAVFKESLDKAEAFVLSRFDSTHPIFVMLINIILFECTDGWNAFALLGYSDSPSPKLAVQKALTDHRLLWFLIHSRPCPLPTMAHFRLLCLLHGCSLQMRPKRP
jgi:hypothetical protein